VPALPLVFYPDPRLSMKAAPVTLFDEALKRLADDLRDTLWAAPGIGITAPHVGILSRLVVTQLAPGEEVRAFVNPVLLSSSGPLTSHTEGSVSMPGVHDEIERPSEVTVKFQTLEGKLETENMTGLMSVVMQHEIDQLDGLFWLQRLSRLKRDRLIKRYEKLRRA